MNATPSGSKNPVAMQNIPAQIQRQSNGFLSSLIKHHPRLEEPCRMQPICMLFLVHLLKVLHVMHVVHSFLFDHLYGIALQRCFLLPRLYL